MTEKTPDELIELKEYLLQGMLNYIEPDEDDGEDYIPVYTSVDVEKCRAILDVYLTAVLEPMSHGNPEKIMAAVKAVVIALNELNEACDHVLIETDQREQICDLIISSAVHAGLDAGDDDITEEWRDW